MLLTTVTSLYAKVTARADRTDVQEGESFYLIIESDNTTASEPNFEELRQDFDISSVMSGVSMGSVNGSSYSIHTWKLMLIPRVPGKLTIPAIKVGSDMTKPITINVSKQTQSATTNHDVFFESTISSSNPYVQEQLIYTMRFYFRQSFIDTQSRLQLPRANGKEMQLIEDPKRFMSRKKGRNYQVFEFHYTLFASKSGELTISAPTFNGIMLEEDPMRPFSGKQRRVSARGKEYKLNVKPIPPSFKGKWWLPAQSVTLAEKWSKSLDKLKTGEPVTRTITMRAVGVSQSQLPDIEFPDMDGVNIYPDKATQNTEIQDNKIVATKKYTVAYVPSRADQFAIPEISIPWFDTKNNSAKLASLPTHALTVVGGVAPVSSSQPSPVVSDAAKTAEKTDSNEHAVKQSRTWFHWLIMMPLILSGWIFGALALYKTRNKRALPTKENENTNLKNAIKQLKKSCNNKDAERAYHDALKAAQAMWPEKNILNLSDVLQFIDDESLRNAINELNNYRYAKQPEGEWNSSEFFQIFQAALKKNKDETKQKTSGLPPLYETNV